MKVRIRFSRVGKPVSHFLSSSGKLWDFIKGEKKIGSLSPYKINWSPYLPSKNKNTKQLVLLLVQVGRPRSYQNPTPDFLAPAEGMGFISVIFLHGNVWFGVPDFVSQRERECV